MITQQQQYPVPPESGMGIVYDYTNKGKYYKFRFFPTSSDSQQDLISFSRVTDEEATSKSLCKSLNFTKTSSTFKPSNRSYLQHISSY